MYEPVDGLYSDISVRIQEHYNIRQNTLIPVSHSGGKKVEKITFARDPRHLLGLAVEGTIYSSSGAHRGCEAAYWAARPSAQI